jgi:Leucine-rich repeat (LRR) protein
LGLAVFVFLCYNDAGKEVIELNHELNFVNPRFEEVVREGLQVFGRPITEEDALALEELDLSDVDFDEADYATLSAFKNLKDLGVSSHAGILSAIASLPKLESLLVECWTLEKGVDLSALSPLHNLRYLFITGGDVSNMDILHTEVLTEMKQLEEVSFHEFGSVDLQFLRDMPQIKTFFCGWANRIEHIDAIGFLTNLKSLTMIYVDMDNLDFLDTLPEDIEIELCALKVKEGIQMEKLVRFPNHNYDDLERRY